MTSRAMYDLMYRHPLRRLVFGSFDPAKVRYRATTTRGFRATPRAGSAEREKGIDVGFPQASCQNGISNDRARSNESVEVRSAQDGRGSGVYSLADFGVGELVMAASVVDVLHHRHSHSLQVGWSTHVLMDMPARMVNHSCGEANVGIRLENVSNADDAGEHDISIRFVAIQDIQVDAEILWDYECAEYEIGRLLCRCGSPACRGVLTGFRDHGSIVRELYGDENIAPYLLSEKPPHL